MAQKKNSKSSQSKSGKKSSKASAHESNSHVEENNDHVSTEETQSASSENFESSQESTFEGSSEHSHQDDVRLEFPYADMVRAYAPKAMEVADKVATDWKHEGSFMNLGIENPYANMAVSMGLQKAKEIEKKLEEKGVMSAFRMGLEVIKTQVKKK